MKTIKYLLIFLFVASICSGQSLRQNQVRALPDSLAKKLNITSFASQFAAQWMLKDLDDLASGTTNKAVTDSEKTIWNGVKDGLTTDKGTTTLADSAEVTFTTTVAGWGRCMIGDKTEYAAFMFDSSGVVTLDSSWVSTNVSTTYTDDSKLVIYDAGSGIGIRNMLGSSLKLAFKIEYYTP